MTLPKVRKDLHRIPVKFDITTLPIKNQISNLESAMTPDSTKSGHTEGIISLEKYLSKFFLNVFLFITDVTFKAFQQFQSSAPKLTQILTGLLLEYFLIVKKASKSFPSITAF